MNALVRLSAPVFLEINLGPANMILHIAKERGQGPQLAFKKPATYHPEPPNSQQTRAC